MLSSQERMHFNGLRSHFYLSARILYLFDQYQNGSFLFGYAIELIFKQALLENGNMDKKLQYGHDLKQLFEECKKIKEFQNIQVPEDFVDFSNSLFQIRYPSYQKKESEKAMARNKVIGWEKNLLFCYDDYFQQLDEALYNFTNDHYSSTILLLFAGIDNLNTQFVLHYNSPVLRHYELYKERTKMFFKKNISAIHLLKNDPEYFWMGKNEKNPLADFTSSLERRELQSFKFPGNVIRDKNGNITNIEFFF
jgi:hypothetical protein